LTKAILSYGHRIAKVDIYELSPKNLLICCSFCQGYNGDPREIQLE